MSGKHTIELSMSLSMLSFPFLRTTSYLYIESSFLILPTLSENSTELILISFFESSIKNLLFTYKSLSRLFFKATASAAPSLRSNSLFCDNDS